MKKPTSIDEFIEGANEAPKMKVARKRIKYDDILLYINGRVPKSTNYKRVIFSLPPDLEEDIERFCSGSRQAVFLWLLRSAIEELKRNNKKIVEDISE